MWILSVESHEEACEVADRNDELQELVECEDHQLLAALLQPSCPVQLPDLEAAAQVDPEVYPEEQVGGGGRGHRAQAGRQEHQVELAG